MPSPSPAKSEAYAGKLQAIGARIRGRRKELHVSAVATAEAAGLSRVTLHRIERGEASVTIGAYMTAMAALGLEVAVVDAVTAVEDDAPDRRRSTPATTPTSRVLRKQLPESILLADFPQLKQLAWHIPHAVSLTPSEAFGLYERHWRHLDAQAMDERERHLLDLLIKTIGKGHLLV